ncbi:MFS transporter [Hydrogenimonas thermophila]|uniref:MFS transporter n=1 Tax=Hydrogenimonas thermophila TaxID=223786 RepID=UPI0029370AD7|nr:MFS transporter [Hydrogenimonas thermophila]WOE70225.1 MFS transporter [Hydrogenimonas thermophila]WOE72742.1 MFS transporter [Hydrogenimonas thermophila]
MRKRFNKIEVATISIAHMVHDIYTSFLAPILPLLIEKLGISLSMVALLDIARKIPALFNPFLGLLAQRKDARYFVILTPAVTAMAMTLLGLADSYITLFILLFIAGISTALFHIPAPGIVKIASGDKTGFGMSCFMAGGELARTLGPLVVTAAITFWGLEGIWRVMPLGLVASLILYFRLKNFGEDYKVTKTKEKGDVKKVLSETYRFFILIAMFMIFQSSLKVVMTLYLPLYLTNQGFDLWYAGISLSVLQFFGVIGTLVSGTLSDKIGRKKTLLVSGLLAVLFMILFLYSKSTFSMFLSLSLIGLFIFASGPVLLALVHDLKTDMPTFLNSIYMTINFGVTSSTVFLMGFIGDHYGLTATYQTAIGLALCALPLTFFLSSEKRAL